MTFDPGNVSIRDARTLLKERKVFNSMWKSTKACTTGLSYASMTTAITQQLRPRPWIITFGHIIQREEPEILSARTALKSSIYKTMLTLTFELI